MDFEKLMQERYTCKHYDASKKIPAELITRLLQTVRLTPSAVNLQPWYFFVAETDAAKAKIAPGVMEMNAERFEKCSHVIVLCARTDATEEYISKVVDKEDADGRFGRVPGARAGCGEEALCGASRDFPVRAYCLELAQRLSCPCDLNVCRRRPWH